MAALSFSAALAHAQDPKPIILIGGEAEKGGALEHPRAVALLPDRIVVLERGEPFLKVFGIDGRLRQQAVRQGAGPDEMREPHSMAWDPVSRRLVVFDPPNGRADYFSLDDTLRYETARRTTLNPFSACFMGGKLYALDLHEGRIVHELRPDGAELTITRSLGEPRSSHPLAQHPMFQGYVAFGPMYCDEAGNRLVVGAFNLGTVQVVSLGSAGQRTIQLPNFIPLDYSAGGKGRTASLSMSLPAGGEWDEITGIRPDADGIRLIAGHGDKSHEGLGDYAFYREHILTPTGVRPKPAVRHWVEIGIDRGRAVCYQGSPYPTLAIFAERRCP
jgi:hypothetical protein